VHALAAAEQVANFDAAMRAADDAGGALDCRPEATNREREGDSQSGKPSEK
jgi:hypothetical protein